MFLKSLHLEINSIQKNFIAKYTESAMVREFFPTLVDTIDYTRNVEAEAVKGYRFHFDHSYRTLKFKCAFFKKIYDEKLKFDRLLFAKKHFLKAVDQGQPPPYQLKDEPCS